MKKTLFAAVFLAVPAFGSTLKCEPSRLALFAGLKIETIHADGRKVVVGGEAALNFVPEPGFTQHQEIKYSVSGWNWDNGLTVSSHSTEMTTGQHGSATIRLPGLKAPTSSPALRAYLGTVSLLPSSTTVRPRLVTKVPVRCFYKK